MILALFLSGYMLADSRTLVKNFVRLLPQPWDDRLAAQIGPISNRMGSYIRGRLLVSTILAVATTVSLSILGLSDFALGLGAISGFTNLISLFGADFGSRPRAGGRHFPRRLDGALGADSLCHHPKSGNLRA